MSSSNTALITGASAGIGAVYADRLARRGHDLILVARGETRLNALAERLRAEAGRLVEVLAADLSARPDLLRIERRLRQDPSIAMLVNNAGVAVSGPMHGSDVDRLEAMVDINVTAALRLAHAAVAAFVARGSRHADQRLFRARPGARAVQRGLQWYQGLHAEPQRGAANRVGGHRHPHPGGAARRHADRTLGKAGVDIAAMPAGMLMDVGEMVDAALAGLDMGEAVTIPSLPDMADWSRFNDARLALGPNLSLAHAAERYRRAGAAA